MDISCPNCGEEIDIEGMRKEHLPEYGFPEEDTEITELENLVEEYQEPLSSCECCYVFFCDDHGRYSECTGSMERWVKPTQFELQNGDYEPDEISLLNWAARTGREEIVEKLLETSSHPDTIAVKNGKTALFEAVENNEIGSAKLLLKAGAAVGKGHFASMKKGNLWSGNVESCLFAAARYDNSEAAKTLLAHGGDPARSDSKDRLPIHAAIDSDSPELVKLLARKQDTYEEYTGYRSKSKDMLHPLHYAAERGNAEAAQALLAEEVDVDVESGGRTALHASCAECKADLVEALLSAGADHDAQNGNGETPLQVAVREEADDVARLLIESGADPDIQSEDGETPLHIAVREKAEDIAHLLIENGADPNLSSRKGETPMHAAVEKGSIELLGKLLGSGGDPSAGERPIMYHVAGSRRVECLKRLQEAGFDPTETDASLLKSGSSENNPLHVAIREDSRRLTSLLLGGADTTDAEKFETPPLETAAKHDSSEAAEELLSRGFLPNYPGSNQPLNVACRNGSKETARVLVRYGADKEHARDPAAPLPMGLSEIELSPLMEAVKHDSAECARVLLEADIDPLVPNERGLSPIHMSALHDSTDVAGLLLRRGANPNKTVEDREGNRHRGKSPMHIVASEGHCDLLELLIEAGGDPNMSDRNGNTPLHEAIRSSAISPIGSDATPTLKAESMLLDAGGNMEITNEAGATPGDIRKKRAEAHEPPPDPDPYGHSSPSSSPEEGWHGDWLKTDGQWVHRDEL
jgi:ankyrin repeat protein